MRLALPLCLLLTWSLGCQAAQDLDSRAFELEDIERAARLDAWCGGPARAIVEPWWPTEAKAVLRVTPRSLGADEARALVADIESGIAWDAVLLDFSCVVEADEIGVMTFEMLFVQSGVLFMQDYYYAGTPPSRRRHTITHTNPERRWTHDVPIVAVVGPDTHPLSAIMLAYLRSNERLLYSVGAHVGIDLLAELGTDSCCDTEHTSFSSLVNPDGSVATNTVFGVSLQERDPVIARAIAEDTLARFLEPERLRVFLR